MASKQPANAVWSDGDLAFKVVKANSLAFANMTREVSARGAFGAAATVLYDAVALRYNQCAPGDLFILHLPNRPTMSNLRKHFKARGLDENDYRLFRPSADESGKRYRSHQRPLALQRLTSHEMTTVQPFPTEAAKLAKEASERGTEFNFEEPGKLVITGPADHFPAGNEDVVNT